MFWSFVTPFIISLILLSIAYLGLRKSKYRKFSLLATLVVSIPTYVGINTAFDLYRFQKRVYSQAKDIQFDLVKSNVPRASTNITLYFEKGGYWAKFTIQKQELDSWFDSQWKSKGDLAAIEYTPPKKTSVTPNEPHQFNSLFYGKGWQTQGTLLNYFGPMYQNGSGSILFYDPQSNVAYQFYSFW